MTNYKRFNVYILLFVIAINSVLLSSCAKDNDENVGIAYSELKAEDMEIIDNINQNIDCEFKLLEEMNVDGKPAEGPYSEYSSGYGEVKSYGVFVSEKDAPLRTSIYIIKPSDYSIFGVKYADKYVTAKELVEGAGFTFVNEEPFNSNTTTITYVNGIAEIVIEIDHEYGVDLEAGTVSRIGVSIPLEEGVKK